MIKFRGKNMARIKSYLQQVHVPRQDYIVVAKSMAFQPDHLQELQMSAAAAAAAAEQSKRSPMTCILIYQLVGEFSGIPLRGPQCAREAG